MFRRRGGRRKRKIISLKVGITRPFGSELEGTYDPVNLDQYFPDDNYTHEGLLDVIRLTEPWTIPVTMNGILLYTSVSPLVLRSSLIGPLPPDTQSFYNGDVAYKSLVIKEEFGCAPLNINTIIPVFDRPDDLATYGLYVAPPIFDNQGNQELDPTLDLYPDDESLLITSCGQIHASGNSDIINVNNQPLIERNIQSFSSESNVVRSRSSRKFDRGDSVTLILAGLWNILNLRREEILAMTNISVVAFFLTN